MRIHGSEHSPFRRQLSEAGLALVLCANWMSELGSDGSTNLRRIFRIRASNLSSAAVEDSAIVAVTVNR
jgi:hypothetical protein